MDKDVLRSIECLRLYRKYRQDLGDQLSNVDLLTLPIVSRHTLWVVVENQFPYDKIASKHHMLVPIRKFEQDDEMTREERQELFEIKHALAATREFDSIFENLKHNRTVPTHYHLHCIKFQHVTPLSELA